MTMIASPTTVKNKPRDSSRPTGSRPKFASPEPKSIDYDRIAGRAYEIWEREGCPEGQCERHWQQAEMELRQS